MIRRVLFPAVVVVALYYAIFGGEYTAFDLRSFRAEVDRSGEDLVELREETEALRARADSLESDDTVLERLARERFGLIRDGEILYRFAEPPPEVEEVEGEADRGGGG